MRFKSLALISAATTALGIGFASPALARSLGDGDGGFGGGGFGGGGFGGGGFGHHHSIVSHHHLGIEGGGEGDGDGGGGSHVTHAGFEHFRHFRHFERTRFEPRERERECRFFCTAPIFDRDGKEVARLRVHVEDGRIDGEIHPNREFEAKENEEFPVHGFCREFGEGGRGGEGEFGEGRFRDRDRDRDRGRAEHERETELTEWTRAHALHAHHENEENEEPESEEHEESHEAPVTHARETVSVPSGAARTGFGGSSDAVSLPLAAGALSLIAGGIGLGGLAARRRLSGVRS